MKTMKYIATVLMLQAEACELERLACAKEKELLDEINEELKV